ncbi:MAG: amidohydrolase family protein [Gemmatimonadota bacterium]
MDRAAIRRTLASASAVAIAIAISACASARSSRAPLDADLVIVDATVVDVESGRLAPGQTVLIKGQRILAVEPSGRSSYSSAAAVIDGRGKFVIPGLWDMHAHFNPATALRIEMPLTLAHGVTGVRIMGADRPSQVPAQTMGLNLHRLWQAQVDSGRVVGPRLVALASWAVNGASGITDPMPAFYKATTAGEGEQLARYFKERGFDFIKVYNNVSRDGYLGMAAEARRLGLPLAGHEPAALSALEISEAGQKSLEHSRIFLFNCFPGADSLRRNLVPAAQRGTALRRRMVDEYNPVTCRTLFDSFAKNGTWITPTHVTRRMDAMADDPAYRNDERLRFISYAQRMSWTADANGMVAQDSSTAGRRSFMDFYTKGLSLTGEAFRAGVPVMLGTDAGDTYVFPGASVHDELTELVKAGLSPAQALRAATLAGATYLGKEFDHGTVAAGRFADLVVLDADPLAAIGNTKRINAVVLNGRLFERAKLDSMLTSVERAALLTTQAQLWLASVSGDTLSMSTALAAGARIDSLDPTGNRRALNYAAINNRVQAVRFLVARGASLNLRNGTGFTPANHAAESGAAEALAVLITAGADLSIADNQGRKPIDTARLRGHQRAVQVIEGASRPQ